jgi:hypothetical protein
VRPLTCLGVSQPRPPFFRRLDRLALDARRTGLSLLAHSDPHVATEQVVHHVPGAVLLPAPNILVDDLPWGQVVGRRRQAHPLRRIYKMPFRISRLGYFSGRPPGLAVGT